MSSTFPSAPGPFGRAARTTRTDSVRRWNYGSISDRLSMPLSASDDTLIWGDACDNLEAIYHSERMNDFSGGHVVRARKWYAIAHDASRNIRRTEDDYAVALVTLRGQTRTNDNGHHHPLDYREAITDSWPEVKYQLDQIERKYDGLGYFRVVAGNGNSAYSHIHIVMFLRDTEISREDFSAIREAHVSNSPVARDITRDNHIRIREKSEIPFEARTEYDRTRGPVDPATKYVASQIPHIGGLSQTDKQLEHSAVCTQTQKHDVMVKQSLRERADSERRERELGCLRALAESERMLQALGDPLDLLGIAERFEQREPESDSLLHVFSTKTHLAKLDMVRFRPCLNPSKFIHVRLNPSLRALFRLYLSTIPD